MSNAKNKNRRWTAIPATRSSASVLKMKLRAVMGVVIFAALAGPIALLSVIASNGNVAEPVEGVNYEAAAFVTQVARDFVSGEATEVAAVQGVDVTFGTPFIPQTVSVETVDITGMTEVVTATNTIEYYEVVVHFAGGKAVGVTVPVVYGSDAQPALAGTPSITPISVTATRGTDAFVSDWTEGADKTVDGPVVTAALAWSTAYTSGSSSALQTLTGDQDPEALYEGVTGVTVSEVSVSALLVRETDSLAIIRVRSLVSLDSANGHQVATAHDLLVEDHALPNPRVVAWGPAGTGLELAPFINNINKNI